MGNFYQIVPVPSIRNKSNSAKASVLSTSKLYITGLVVILLSLLGNSSFAQPWVYDFGTGTGSYTSAGVNTTLLPVPPSGDARLRIGTNPGSFVLANPGLVALGTESELQMTSNTGSASTTKFSIYDYSTTKAGYVKFKIAFSGGTNGVYKFSLGDGVNYSDNNAIGNAQIFAGIEWSLGSSNSVTYRVLNNTTMGTNGITGSTTLFTQSTTTVYSIEIYANNNSTPSTYKRASSDNSLAAGKWDLWVDGVLVGPGLAKGAQGANSALTSFAFNHQVSVTAPGTIYLDDFEYSNALPTGPACTAQTITAISPASITKTYGDANYSVATTATSGLTVTYSSSIQAVATVDAAGDVTIVGAGTTTITAAQSGDGTYCAATSVTQALTVNKKTLTITGLTADNKIFDGTTTATLSGSAALSGVVSPDAITLGGTPIANFNNATVGTNKPVTVTGYTISGPKSANYNLTQPTGLTADITAPASSITLTPATQAKGPYCNGTTNNIAITYTTTGTITAPYIELSNAAGSFASGTTNLGGTVTGSGTFTITGTIPAAQAVGTAYRVRIVSTDAIPVISYTDNGSNITINITPGTPNVATPAAVCEGVRVTLAGTGSSGATAYSYWDAPNGGTKYSSAGGYTVTAANLTTPAALTAGTYTYYVQGDNGALCSSLIRQAVTVTINPVVATPSVTQTAACGSVDLSFTAPVGGTAYWQTVATGTLTTNTANPYTVTNSGNYYLRVQASPGGCWSTAATVAVTINAQPVITVHPASTSVTSPSSASFSVTTTGTVSSYQWQTYDGSSWVNLTNGAPYSGVNLATLTVNPTNILLNDGEYRCVVSGTTPCISVTSNSAMLTVEPGPCFFEGFESGVPTGYSSGGPTTFENAGWTYTRLIRGNGANAFTGSYSAQLESSTGSNLISPVLSSIGTISFKAKGSTNPSAVQVRYRTDPSDPWTAAPGSPFSFSTAWVTITTTLNLNQPNLQFQIYRTAGTVYVDDVSISCYVPPCVSAATITDFKPSNGPVGTLVTITGTGFTGATGVKFGGLSASSFTVESDSRITARVPNGAGTGKISVQIGACPATSGTDFTLTQTAGACGIAGGGSTVTDISISEVYDANGGSLSYIEVFNGTASTVTLGAPNNYVVRVRTGTGTDADYPLSGTLASGATYLIKIGTGEICSGVTPKDDYPTAAGFNGNDRIYLRKNNVDIDYVPNPNYGGGDAPGFSQSRKPVTTAVTIPSTTYTASDWIISTTENCTGLNVAPYTVNGSSITITTTPTDVNCGPINFTVESSGTGPGTNSYVWKYYNPATNAWENASGITSATLGVTASNTNTNSMSITGNIGHLLNYQFYCEITRGSCKLYTDAVLFTYDTRPIYKSNIANGVWNVPGNWLMSTDGVNFVSTCTYPTAINSDHVIIKNGDNIVLNTDLSVDKLTIESGGLLEIATASKLTILNGQSGEDFIVEGTLYDRGSSGNGISYEDNSGTANDASWKLGTTGTVIKTNTSSIARYRDFYQGGMTTIPATGTFVFRYNGDGMPTTGSAGYTYPNLIFENTSSAGGNYSWNTSTSALTGGVTVGSYITVKGDLIIGGTVGSTGTVSLFNNNINAQPLLVNGNANIAIGSTLTNLSYNAIVDANHGYGTGIEIKGNLIVEGTLNLNNNDIGLLYLSGTNAQTVSGVGTIVTNEYRMDNTNATGITSTATVSVYKTFSLNGTTKLTLNDGLIRIKSVGAKTAAVSQIDGGTITYGGGLFEIERDINIGTGLGQHTKTWQFLATPVQSDPAVTIKANWQENGTNPTGYGTWLTDVGSTGAGFDGYSATPALKLYDRLSDSWLSPGSTTIPISDTRGYMVFVRGDRSVSSVNGAANATNLRIRGKIYAPNVAPPSTVIPGPSMLASIGNPYASSIDFEKIRLTVSTIDENYTVWDPSLKGSYAAGGYQSIVATTGYIATPGTTVNYSGTNDYRNIQSGQAFFVMSKANATSGATIPFTESLKTSGSRIANRTGEQIVDPTAIQMFSTFLFTNEGEIADGNRVVPSTYSSEIDEYDARKFYNSGENFGLVRNGKFLAVEARGKLTATDTLFYKSSNLKQADYKLVFAPQNLAYTGLEAYLVDNFTQTRHMVSLQDTTKVQITVTSEAASKASNRFMIVFRAVAGPLPVTFISVSANRNADQTVAVNWKVANEINIEKYTIERSTNAVQFNSIGTSNVLNNTSYNYTDANAVNGILYYRVKATSVGGQVQYSAVVKVAASNQPASINVYPNPVVGKQVQVEFTNQITGNYQIQITNKLGQVVYQDKLQVTTGNFVKSISLGETAAAGTYHLVITDQEGKKKNIQLLVN